MYNKQENKILNEICEFCLTCDSMLRCKEDDCVLYRIEQIIVKNHTIINKSNQEHKRVNKSSEN